MDTFSEIKFQARYACRCDRCDRPFDETNAPFLLCFTKNGIIWSILCYDCHKWLKDEIKNFQVREHSKFIEEIVLSDNLQLCGVTRLARENNILLLELERKTVVIFNIQRKGLFATLQQFEDNCRDKKIDCRTAERIIFILSHDEHYRNILLWNQGSTHINHDKGITGYKIKEQVDTDGSTYAADGLSNRTIGSWM
jgi:hypothetical protein